jgi:PKD repeat protein
MGGTLRPGASGAGLNTGFNALRNKTAVLSLDIDFRGNAQGGVDVNTTVEIVDELTHSNLRLVTVLIHDGPGLTRFIVVRYHARAFTQTEVGSVQTYTQSFNLNPHQGVVLHPEYLRAISWVQTASAEIGTPPWSNGAPRTILNASIANIYALNPSFTPNILEGPSSLKVSFANTSFVTADDVTWEWDFTGNGQIDSTEKEPSWEFDTIGSHTVSLTVRDGEYYATITKENIITVTNSNNISGLVAGTWLADLSPYIITDSIEVPQHSTLLIEAGVELIFMEGTDLIVRGRLETAGEIDNMVIFTSRTSWGGISIEPVAQNAEFRHTLFENASVGALRTRGTNIHVEGCIFINNASVSTAAAIDLFSATNSLILGSFIVNNSSSESSGAIASQNSGVRIQNSIIVNNTGNTAGAILGRNAANVINIENSVIFNNQTTTGGSISALNNSRANIMNSILNGVVPIYRQGTGVINVDFTNISSGSNIDIDFTPASGNLNMNPMFRRVSGGWGHTFETNYVDWVLANNSPLIDAGNPASEFNDRVNPANPTFALFPALGRLRNDMGAFGGPQGKLWVEDDFEPSVYSLKAVELIHNEDAIIPDYESFTFVVSNIGNAAVRFFTIHLMRYTDDGASVSVDQKEISYLLPGQEGSFTLLWNIWDLGELQKSGFEDHLFYGVIEYSVDMNPDYARTETIKITIFVSEYDETESPLQTALLGNFPNPFNPATNIMFELATPENVSITIYNIRGQRVKTLVNTQFETGRHVIEWGGIDNHGNRVSSGIYFYLMQTDSFSATSRMLLLK